MEIRKLKPEENVYMRLAGSICYVSSAPAEDRYSWLENPLEHTKGYETAWGAFDETGRLLSSMSALPAQIMINNQPVKAGLIAGVTTLPEARNASCVRKIFKAVLEDMKAGGVVYSLLFPFSSHFYRKFGYEHAYARPCASFPIGGLSRYPYPGGVKVHDKGDPWADFAKVYKVFSRDKNLAMVRGPKEWESLLNRDPHKDRKFTYIHYNQAGEPDAYILYGPSARGQDYCLQIQELAWADKHGLEAMLGFVHGMRSEYTRVIWPLPVGFDVFSMLDEPKTIDLTMDSMPMNRVVDVHAALALMEAPIGTGSVVMKLLDKFIESNTGMYEISWENGKLNVTRSGFMEAQEGGNRCNIIAGSITSSKNAGNNAQKPSSLPDIELNVETLVQLTTGYLTPAQAQYRRGVTIHGKEEALAALFPKKDMYMMEDF